MSNSIVPAGSRQYTFSYQPSQKLMNIVHLSNDSYLRQISCIDFERNPEVAVGKVEQEDFDLISSFERY